MARVTRVEGHCFIDLCEGGWTLYKWQIWLTSSLTKMEEYRARQIWLLIAYGTDLFDGKPFIKVTYFSNNNNPINQLLWFNATSILKILLDFKFVFGADCFSLQFMFYVPFNVSFISKEGPWYWLIEALSALMTFDCFLIFFLKSDPIRITISRFLESSMDFMNVLLFFIWFLFLILKQTIKIKIYLNISFKYQLICCYDYDCLYEN